MPTVKDPATGRDIFIDPGTGKAQLRDRKGNVYQVGVEKASQYIASGDYDAAAPEDVVRYDKQKEANTTVGQLKAIAEGAVVGGIDATTAIATVPTALVSKALGVENPLEEVQGRKVLENLSYIGGELAGDSGEKVSQEYAENARIRGESGWGTAGRVAGEIVGGLGLSGAATQLGRKVATATGSRVAGMAAGMGTEGALLGGAQAAEQAYLEDTELTAERLLGGVGLGAVLGGGVALGVGALTRPFVRSGSRGATAVDGPVMSAQARQADIERVAERALGRAPRPETIKALTEMLNEPYSTAASAVSGGEKSVISRYGVFNLSKEAREARRLVNNAPKILEDATETMTRRLEQVADNADDVFEEVVDAGLKRSNITPKLTGDKVRMAAVAREELDAARRGLREALERADDDFGNKALLQRALKHLDAVDPRAGAKLGLADDALPPTRAANDAGPPGLIDADYLRTGMRDESLRPLKAAYEGADAAEAELIATGQKAARNSGKNLDPVTVNIWPDAPGGRWELRDGRHRMMAADAAGAKNILANVRKLDEFGDVVEETLTTVPIRTPEPARIAAAIDPADAFIALDRAKRALQKNVRALRTSASRSGDALQQMQGRQLADYIEGFQERIRKNLENADVWGDAANAQKAINAKWGEFIQTQEMFRSNFLQRVEGPNYQTGRATYRVDPDKVARYIRKTGKQEGALVDEYFRRHIQARQELSDAIADAFELGDKQTAVQGIREGTRQIKQTLGELDKTARVVNEIEDVIAAERGDGLGAMMGAVGGGLVAGPLGAAAGAAAGLLLRPGTALKKLAAVEALAGSVDGKINRSLGKFFSRTTEAAPIVVKKLGAAARTTGRGARRAVMPTLFGASPAERREQYRKTVKELVATTSNPQLLHERITKAYEGVGAEAPQLTRALTVKSLKGLDFLASKVPAPLLEQKSFAPHRTEVDISDSEIAEFESYYKAVTNPLSVLDDLRDGVATHEQMDALRAVYPALYNDIRLKAIDYLAKSKTDLPYQARLQLDLLMDLNGAADVTMSADFMTRLDEYRAAIMGAQPEPSPARGSAPNLSGAYKSRLQEVESTLRG